ncbi:MAG: glutamate--cysteine ligase [Alphaproteobacteria bacterium]|nr:glutamate--cysteine ligase [Alphaproteobacteria bacterium]
MKKFIHNKVHELLLDQGSKIEEWIAEQYKISNISPLFFTSVDIRDSGTKVAPIDTNVFPAGFNNIAEKDLNDIAKFADEFMNAQDLGKKILLIPEDHTRNQFYLENIKSLKRILEGKRRNVKIASIAELSRVKDRIVINNLFDPDVIILNNDFSRGMPEILYNLEQRIIPSLDYGWHSRTKSFHFSKYEEVLNKFCLEFNLEKFFLLAKFLKCGEVNFQTSKGIDCIANHADKMIHVLKKEYKDYGIKDEPYLFVKADSGTYGMGIMTVRSGEEVYSMNRKLRKKMHIIKDGLVNERVIIQEGIKTELNYENQPAEPMIYMLGGKPIQSLMRVNSTQDSFESLNRSGAQFFSMNVKDQDSAAFSYMLVAKLASLAAAQETSKP